MYNHYFDANGAYRMTTEAYEWAIRPPDAIRSETPLDIPAGFWPVVNQTRDGWDLVEDHRGKEGYVDGKAVKIAALGPLPEGWTIEKPVPPDTRTPEEKRRDAYLMEADPLLEQSRYYQAEAEGWSLLGEQANADAATAKARGHLKAYAAKKEEIRARYPDADSSPVAVTEPAAVQGLARTTASAGPDKTRYCLNTSGVYHAEGCAYASEAGAWLTLAEIDLANPSARPCTRCGPPELIFEEDMANG